MTMFPHLMPHVVTKRARRSRVAHLLRSLCWSALVVFSFAFPATGRADWPDRTVKVIVTFPAGSANDAAARLLADALGRRWKKPVVVEARPGAEGTLGVREFVASQDDHTLLYTVGGSVSVAPLLIDKLPYDPDRDLVPIAATTAIVLTLAVSGDLPVRSIPELIAELKANPGKYAWTSGPTIPRFAFTAFLKKNGLQMTYVSYRDAAQPQADLGEGRIKALLTSWTASSSPVHAGKARFLAVANPTRAAVLPDIPTARELGHPELEIDGLAGFFGGRTMTDEQRMRIAADVAAVCKDPELRRKLEAGGHVVLNGTPEELKAAIAAQKIWIGELAKLVDIRNAQ